jgi:hypothetical protein
LGICFQNDCNSPANRVSCDSIGTCSAWSCCLDFETCLGLGHFFCCGPAVLGYQIHYIDAFLCPYQFTCCS